MPFVHREHFKIRHYECNAHGVLHHANYLRYMQEAAFAGSDAVGYGARKYATIGLQWLAYETQVHYLKPLYYEDRLHINTWVEDFRRVRSLRRYEFYRDTELVAYASTDWVLINTQTNYPATIPEEIIVAYSQGEPFEIVDKRVPFPRLNEVPENAFVHQRAVEWRDIDEAQHVNNAVYLHYTTNAEFHALAHLGWSPEHQNAHGGALRTQRNIIEYKFPATLGDEVQLSTWVENVTDQGCTRHFRATRSGDNKLLTRISAYQTWIDAQTGEPAPLPVGLRDALTTV